MASTENGIVPAADSPSLATSRDQTPTVMPEPAAAAALAPDFDLTPAQAKALQVMHEGQGVLSAAKAAGVCRATIYYWLKHDPTFIAAHNMWRRQCRQEVTNKLLSLRDKAMDVVSAALDKGEFRAATAVLRYIDKLPEGLADPDKTNDLPDHRARFPKSRDSLNESNSLGRMDRREMDDFIAALGIKVIPDKTPSPTPALEPPPSATE